MKGTKHKIFILAEPLKNGMFKCFLLQSGDIGQDRSTYMNLMPPGTIRIFSNNYPALDDTTDIRLNGDRRDKDFIIASGEYTKELVSKLKEAEYAYNNR